MTLTPSLTPTATWIFQSRNITCPILLYHRIDSHENPYSTAARYYMAPEEFRWQMQALKDWGYTSIPISLLVQAEMTGAE